MEKKEAYLRRLIKEFGRYDVPLDDDSDKPEKIVPSKPSEDEGLKIIDISGLSTYPRRNEKLPQNKYFIIHHTAIRSSAETIVKILNQEKKGVQYIVDREGKVYQSLPLGSRGAHMKNSDMVLRDAGNDTAQGVEVVANDDRDVTYLQALTVLKLVKHLGFTPSKVFGHGEVNSHKMRDEGSRIKSFILNNFNKSVSEILKDIPNVEDTIKSPGAI